MILGLEAAVLSSRMDGGGCGDGCKGGSGVGRKRE